MREVLIFSGTTEGRKLAQELAEYGIPSCVSVATEYGSLVMPKAKLIRIHQGRLDADGMRQLMEDGDFAAVVDATHPYAVEVSAKLRQVMKESSLPYYRLKRSIGEDRKENTHYFSDSKALFQALKETNGNILLTTGSKELSIYAADPEIRKRLFVRVLPSVESLLICKENGIEGRQVLALQGPFTEELNEALIRQFDIKILVTKQSGKNGGYQEKREAAKHTGCSFWVIGAPEGDTGASYEEVKMGLLAIYEKIAGKVSGKIIEKEGEQVRDTKREITLAGMGMGAEELLTVETRQALLQADVIIGAERILKKAKEICEKERLAEREIRYYPYYQPAEVLPILTGRGYQKAVLLYSGDTGFYSGAEKMHKSLVAMLQLGEIQARIKVCPGISSVSCLASRIGESWQDSAILSIHGRQARVEEVADRTARTYVLVSGVEDVQKLGRLFAGRSEIRIWVGRDLSSVGEQVVLLTSEECQELTQPGLYICMILNSSPKKITRQEIQRQPEQAAESKRQQTAESRRQQIAESRGQLAPGLPDSTFLRDRIPMTKEEIRALSICKLRLYPGAIVYDVGCGTGSVTVECARLDPAIQVYGLDKKPEAIALTRKNSEAADLKNVHLLVGEAPEALRDLPAPTHAFIGGSTGQLEEIIQVLFEKNPDIRIVINAVTFQTLGQVSGILGQKKMEGYTVELLQIQVNRMRELGSYHALAAENPVYIATMQRGGEKDGNA